MGILFEEDHNEIHSVPTSTQDTNARGDGIRCFYRVERYKILGSGPAQMDQATVQQAGTTSQ